MTPILSLEITLRIPLEKRYGTRRFGVLVFDTKSAPDFCVIRETEWRKNDANSALFHSGGLNPKRMAQGASLSPPNVATMTQRPSIGVKRGPPFGAENGAEKPLPETSKNTPQEDLSLAREIIAGKAAEMALLDSRLSPVRDEERRLRDSILATHGTRDGVVLLNIDRAGDRAPLFTRLNQISSEWGPTKTERGNLNRQIKALEREVVQLEKAIINEGRKKRRA